MAGRRPFQAKLALELQPRSPPTRGSTYPKTSYSRFVNPLATVIDSIWDVYGTNHVQGRRRTDCSFTGLSSLSQLVAVLLDSSHFRDHISKAASRTDPVMEQLKRRSHGYKPENALFHKLALLFDPSSVIQRPESLSVSLDKLHQRRIPHD